MILSPNNYTISTAIPRSIIIHSTSCVIPFVSNIQFDDSSFQISKYHTINWNSRKTETKFHYIIELIKDDYQIVVSQPLLTLSEFDDLFEDFGTAIHIGLLGDYQLDFTDIRLYEVLAYRLIVPLMRAFRITPQEIYKHSDISDLDDCMCPGHNFDLDKLKQYTRKYLKQYNVHKKN